MVIIIIKKDNEDIEEISFLGHAQNIVCAAISTLLPATVNYIYLLEPDTVDYIDDSNLTVIKVLQKTKYNQMFLKQMIRMLQDIQEKYPQDILLKEEESKWLVK